MAAKITRKALKREYLADAYHREISLIKIFHIIGGKRGPDFIPLQPREEEEKIILVKPVTQKAAQKN